MRDYLNDAHEEYGILTSNEQEIAKPFLDKLEVFAGMIEARDKTILGRGHEINKLESELTKLKKV